jgi:hypothetical protein
MSKHRLHYIDMRPKPLEREPSTVAIWLGATLTVTALCLLTIVLFSF